MPSGVPICALRASARRTSGSGCTGWPTPKTKTGGPESAERKRELGRTESGGSDLEAVALVSGWPTPNAMEGGQTSRGGDRKDEPLMGGVAKLCGWPTPRSEDSEQTGAHRGNLDTLNSASKAAGWVTPQNRDAKGQSQNFCREDKPKDDCLPDQATLAGWATPQCMDHLPSSNLEGRRKKGGCVNLKDQVPDSGPTPSGTPAGTAEPGESLALNPFFSAWLQGFPTVWTLCGLRAASRSRRSSKAGSSSCAATATPSTPGSPPCSCEP